MSKYKLEEGEVFDAGLSYAYHTIMKMMEEKCPGLKK